MTVGAGGAAGLCFSPEMGGRAELGDPPRRRGAASSCPGQLPFAPTWASGRWWGGAAAEVKCPGLTGSCGQGGHPPLEGRESRLS